MARLMRVEAGCARPSDSRSSLIESIEKYVREAVRLSEIDKDVQTEQEARVALVNILQWLKEKGRLR